MKHHPILYRAGRHGCWAECTCGQWHTKYVYTTVTGAHYAFGWHLIGRREVWSVKMGKAAKL